MNLKYFATTEMQIWRALLDINERLKKIDIHPKVIAQAPNFFQNNWPSRKVRSLAPRTP